MKLIKKGQYLQLSTPDTGKTVVFAPNVHDEGEILVKAANKGYYYPLMAIKHLQALSTGLTGKNNVFIPNINDFKTNSFQNVVVFVPGIAVTVERRPDDMLVITELGLSDDYESIARGSQQKPGVYSVVKRDGEIKVSYRNNCRITSEKDRKVVIADTRYSRPADAAEAAVERLDALFGGSAALKCDFDLFYSPLGSTLKGMRNYNSAVVNKTYGFAGLLAGAMELSKNKKGVEWSSERAGSIVLTQALMALAAKNISFKGQEHIVKMCWAKSNPKPAYEAIVKLGMMPDKNLLKSNSHIRATLSATLGNAARARDPNDPYTWNDYGRELANGTMAANTTIGVGALLGGIALAGTPTGAILGTVGTATGLAGAAQFFHKHFKSAKDRR